MARQRVGAIVVVCLILAAALAAALVVRMQMALEREHREAEGLPPAQGEMTPERLAGLLDRRDNAVWVSERFWTQHATEADVRLFASALEARGISRAYLLWEQSSPSVPLTFVEQLRKIGAHVDALMVLRPVGSFVTTRLGEGMRSADAGGNPEAELLVASAKRAVDSGALGVQVGPQDANDAELLRSLRKALPPGAVLSRVLGPEGENLGHVSCAGADEVVLRTFDLDARDPAEFQRHVEGWTAQLARSLGTADGGGCQWRIGLSADPRKSPSHDPNVESFERGLLAIRGTFAQREVPESFRGVAIWGEWAMGVPEWALFDAAWRGAQRVTVPAPETGAALDAGAR